MEDITSLAFSSLAFQSDAAAEQFAFHPDMACVCFPLRGCLYAILFAASVLYASLVVKGEKPSKELCLPCRASVSSLAL